jgi:hypothetical protein
VGVTAAAVLTVALVLVAVLSQLLHLLVLLGNNSLPPLLCGLLLSFMEGKSHLQLLTSPAPCRQAGAWLSSAIVFNDLWLRACTRGA